MKAAVSYVAAPPGELYWRKEVCPHKGAEVLLRTIGGICIKGQWYGVLGEAFTAWCPLPKDGVPPPAIHSAPLLARVRFCWNLIFNPRLSR